MMTEKEKLEEDLNFLKESFESNVITKEEYENAKSKIDARLKELEVSEEKKEPEVEEKAEIEDKKIEEERKEEQKIEIKELREEDIGKDQVKEEIREEEEKEPVKKEEEQEETKKEELTEEDTITIDFSWLKNIFRKKEPEEEPAEVKVEEKDAEQKTLDETKEAEVKVEDEKAEVEEEKTKEEVEVAEEKPEEVKTEEKKAEEVKEEEKPEEVKVEEKKAEEIKVTEEKKEEKVEEEKPEEEKAEEIVDEELKINKKIFVYIAIILILVVGSWYFFFSGEPVSDDATIDSETVGETVSLIACNSDEECSKEGSIGICKNPGQEDAECEYIDDVKIKLTIINSNNCFNCGTARVLSILDEFFPNLDIENIDFESLESNEIITKFGINVLPAYILNSSLEDAYKYDLFSSSFNDVNGNFVMKDTVANANYYIKREEIPNKLDLFLKLDQVASSKAEENLQEFLEAFDVDFEKHDEDSEIVKELGINTFPAFLINNKIKFGGVQAADKIRENFCQLNSVTECALGLTKSLV